MAHPEGAEGIARLTYAGSAQTRGGRAVIRALENVSGRRGLIRKGLGRNGSLAAGAQFWPLMCARFGVDPDIRVGSLDHIAATGPLILVANHPFGILDGLVLGRLLSARRGGDFKILANSVFDQVPDLHDMILPICFDATKAATRQNLATRADALAYLKAGGAIGVFPGGTVSTSARPFSQPLDPRWRSFTAKLVARSDATVVPVYFDGANSRMFQLASHLHMTLRLGLLVREFRGRIKRGVAVSIGSPILPAELSRFKSDPKACMDFLRKATYDMSTKPIAADQYGRAFDGR